MPAAQGLEPAKETQAQLDQLLPAADRKKTLAMARTKPKAASGAKSRKPVAMAAAKPEPKPEPAAGGATNTTEATAEAPAKPAAKPRKPAAVAAAKPKPNPKPAAEEAAEAPAKPPAKKAAEKAAPAERPAPAAKAASGNWRIQLGAFSQRASAQALYNKLSGKAALAGRHASYIPVGNITRLQVGPFDSKGAAQAACKAVGVACFPVPAK